MLTPIGDDELKLKQRARRRLVGAVALLTALVLILPMVMDNEPKPITNEIAVHLPAAQQSPVTPEVAPPEPTKEVASVPLPSVENPSPTPENEPAPPAAVEKEKSVSRETDRGFFVQIGVFAKSENAKSIQIKLAQKKLKATAEQIKTDGGSRTRVRLGPYPTRAEADDVLAKVKLAGEKNAAVVTAERRR